MHSLQGILIVVATSLFSEVNAECQVSDVLPIVSVFNTSERLWYYQVNSTSATQLDTCIFFGFISINQSDYYSWQNESYSPTVNFSERCHGRFINGTREKYGAMSLACGDDPDLEHPFEEMELMYTEPTCSVFFSKYLDNPNWTIACKVYVTDSAVKGGPTENCTKYFNSTCRGSTAVFYDQRCKQEHITNHKLK
uniref:Putative group v salivary lipocalin n=1 Tax=Rhipicephalus pulchellus TaxID=72859 RepID=L7M9Z2_RHIPC